MRWKEAMGVGEGPAESEGLQLLGGEGESSVQHSEKLFRLFTVYLPAFVYGCGSVFSTSRPIFLGCGLWGYGVAKCCIQQGRERNWNHVAAFARKRVGGRCLHGVRICADLCRFVQIHDLYREFAKLEARGKVNDSADFEKRRWVYYEGAEHPTELEKEPPYRCWANLIRIGIVENLKIENLRGIEWGYFSNVEILTLGGLRNLRGELNLRGLKCLRSLEILDTNGLDTVDGLQDLNKLAYFSWISCSDLDSEQNVPRCIMGQLPAALQLLKLVDNERGISFAPNLFTSCTNLTRVTAEVNNSLAKNLDFSACAALESVVIGSCNKVENLTLSGCSSLRTVEPTFLRRLQCVAELRGEMISNLQFLVVQSCPGLVEIPGLDRMVGLQHLKLRDNGKLRKLPDLQKLTRLQVLEISHMHIEEVPGLSLLRQLCKLRWTSSKSTSMKVSSLSGFEELETIDLSGNPGLRSLEGVFGDLPALRRLDLWDCCSLSRLPDLSRARNLENVDLTGSGVKVREEEMRMLAALPHLHPVKVGDLRVDVVKRTVLYRDGSPARGPFQEWRSN